MGYCIELIDANFFISRENKEAALEALFDMWLPEKESNMNGGSYGRNIDEKWYSWMNMSASDFRNRTIPTLENAIEEWGYNVENNDNGDIVSIWFDSDKIGDEYQMFTALAPFVHSGSYLDYRGEDGILWRWEFINGFITEHIGRVVFE